MKKTPEWKPIDYVLIEVCSLIDDYTDTVSGQPIHYEQSNSVTFKAERRIRKSTAAIEAVTNGKNYKAAPGEYWIARAMPVVDGEDLPSLFDWFEEDANKRDNNIGENGTPMSKWAHMSDAPMGKITAPPPIEGVMRKTNTVE